MILCTVLSAFNFFIHPKCFRPQLKCPNPNVTFWLYTRANQDNPHQLLVNDPNTITSAPFIKNASIKILIHGFLGNKDNTPNSELRPEYMKCCNYNIISVDYEPLTRMPCYIEAAYSTELVGMCTAQLVDILVKNYGFDLCSIHPIGFSLGGHAVGFLGNYIKSGRFDRITGLDIALPLFMTSNKNKKLDASDAKFVDVVHTNAVMCGHFERCGTVDFFANNGMIQPGCKFKTHANVCSHTRAVQYFAESINTKVGFYGMKCNTWFGYIIGLCKLFHGNEAKKLFGEYVPLNANGLYYFPTNSKPPFAIGSLRISGSYSDNQEEKSEELEDLTIQNIEFDQEYPLEIEEIVMTLK
ncbi:pancreatic triacylglycerol lipase-like isoform X2 [Hyposmocoma kahamanoa]|uniref:pancreatic triacylglycerol lipase-like isoform X2 n=1 Tax=Hyposmocoma kahamanoa TaxID=1477025 RepID=UPI000E6D998C|nr:pancreatic triacylglycerol lipase-like isoform X2 [Hyposmocoma kahamanoa]